MKVTTKGSHIYKCRTNPKNYKFLRKLATDYLIRLQLFINMFVNNHNFIGKYKRFPSQYLLRNKN